MELFQIYNPITATPFCCNDTYMEFKPCDELKPYIKCFWGTKRPLKKIKTDIVVKGIVTPDTCMDIIFYVDLTNNKINSSFCGINDRTFYTYDKSDEDKIIFTFAIRFYAWSAVLFSDETMKGVCNEFFDANYHFSRIKREIEPLLFDIADMAELIALAEKTLLRHYRSKHENRLILEAVAIILKNKGNLKISQLSKEIHISRRQLERSFQEYLGITPKNFSSLIRYQYLWNDILYYPQFYTLDAVNKYGYTDQAHLLHEFKKFHSMNIIEAKRYAFKDVAFLQA